MTFKIWLGSVCFVHSSNVSMMKRTQKAKTNSMSIVSNSVRSNMKNDLKIEWFVRTRHSCVCVCFADSALYKTCIYKSAVQCIRIDFGFCLSIKRFYSLFKSIRLIVVYIILSLVRRRREVFVYMCVWERSLNFLKNHLLNWMWWFTINHGAIIIILWSLHIQLVGYKCHHCICFKCNPTETSH